MRSTGKAKGELLQLEDLMNEINTSEGTPCQLHKIHGVDRTKLLAWLQLQSEGVFVVEFDGHCISWDAKRKLLLDTDPLFPHPLSLTADNMALFGITQVEKAFQIVRTGSANPKKRNRMAPWAHLQ